MDYILKILLMMTIYTLKKYLKNLGEYYDLPRRQILVPWMSLGCPPLTPPWRPLKILFDHPGDVPNWRLGDVPIWRPGDVSKWRPGDVLIWRQGDVLIWRPRDVLERQFRDVLRTSPRRPWKHVLGTVWGHLLDFPKFVSTFLSELIRLTESI